jgi:hypothetical protein
MESVLVIADGRDEASASFEALVKSFLGVLRDGAAPTWRTLGADEFDSIADLLQIVEQAAPDLVCTHRHLHASRGRDPRTLGDFVEVLTQAVPQPILLMPDPDVAGEQGRKAQNTDRVMAITDHLTGDRRLVNYTVRFTRRHGTVYLTHVEDDAVFERYMGSVSRIPEFDTDVARELIGRQLLKEPADYMASCRRVLAEAGGTVHVEPIVVFGHLVSEYGKLVDQHQVDLLVMNTKDEDQLAMHGLAYPLAVEMRRIPLLML